MNHEENMIDVVCATLGARCTSNRPAPWWRLFIQLRRGTKNQSVYLGGRNGVDVLGAGIGQHIRQERPSGVNSDILKFRGSAAGFDQDLKVDLKLCQILIQPVTLWSNDFSIEKIVPIPVCPDR